MKKFLFVGLLLLSSIGTGQIIQDKLFIEIDLSNGSYAGDALDTEDGFTFPNFYPNLSKSSGWNFYGMYNLSDYVDVGIKYSSFSGSEWSLTDHDFYDSASVQINTFGPNVRLHNKQQSLGFLNRVNVFLECSPYFGISNFDFGKKQVFENSYDFSSTISNLYGVELGVGVKAYLNQLFSLVFHYDYSVSFFSGDIILEESYSRQSFNVGISYTLLKEKNFIYK